MENLNEDEIDLIALLKKIWQGKVLIIRTMLFFMFFGIVFAITRPLIYTSSSTFIPQSDTGSSSNNLSGVASLVGINLGGISNGTEIPPSIYPKILESTSFKRELLNLRLENPDSVSKIKLYEYLTKNKGTDVIGLIKKYTILLPFTILQAIKGVKTVKKVVVANSMFYNMIGQEKPLEANKSSEIEYSTVIRSQQLGLKSVTDEDERETIRDNLENRVKKELPKYEDLVCRIVRVTFKDGTNQKF